MEQRTGLWKFSAPGTFSLSATSYLCVCNLASFSYSSGSVEAQAIQGEVDKMLGKGTLELWTIRVRSAVTFCHPHSWFTSFGYPSLTI